MRLGAGQRTKSRFLQKCRVLIAILIDGVVCAAPMIQAEITADSIPIRDNLTGQQPEDLARKINAAISGNPLCK